MIEAATDHAIDVLQPSIETARDAAVKGHEATRLKWALYATERSKLNPPDSEREQAPRRRARQRRLRGHHGDGNVRPRSLISALAGSNVPETYAAGEPTPRDRDELRRTLIMLGVVVFTIVLSILVKPAPASELIETE